MFKSHFGAIWVSERYYFDLTLVPTKNEFDEDINRCALVDSETMQEIDCIAFDSMWLIPIFQTRSKLGLKEFHAKLKEVTDKHGIVITPRDEMPKDKKAQEVKHIGKKRF